VRRRVVPVPCPRAVRDEATADAAQSARTPKLQVAISRALQLEIDAVLSVASREVWVRLRGGRDLIYATVREPLRDGRCVLQLWGTPLRWSVDASTVRACGVAVVARRAAFDAICTQQRRLAAERFT